MEANVEEALRAAGLAPEHLDTRDGPAYRVGKIPRSVRTTGVSRTGEFFLIAERSAAEAIATILESGSILVAGTELPLHRCAPAPALRRVEERIPEGPGNLGRRADWFKKRR